MNLKNLKLTKEEPGIAIVTIAREAVLNALNSDTLLELRDLLSSLERDVNVRVVILTGEGDKAFIAGADISEMTSKTIAEGVTFAKLGHEVAQRLEMMTKPAIAAVNGFALGGGAEMAIACDFILASENAVFGQPEVGLGIIPGFGATVRLAKFVGLPRAKELIFTGRKVKADEALRIGLCNRVFPQKDLLKETLNMAKQIALHSRTAISKCKYLLNEFSESTGLSYKLDSEAHEFGLLFGSYDQREGMGAFLEKRKPKFEGLENS